MTQSTSTTRQLTILKDWLTLLLKTYGQEPNQALAKVIHYYIERILCQEEVLHQPRLYCQYARMKKFWAWQSMRT